MTGEQIIIAANGVAYVILWFFVRMWINDVKKSIEKIFEKLDGKVSIDTCHTTHRSVDDDINRVESLGKKHRHVSDTGEVVIIS